MACGCGAGISQTKDGLEIRPHDLDCPELRRYVRDNPPQGLTGEAALQFLERSGAGWIREAIEDDILDAEYLV